MESIYPGCGGRSVANDPNAIDPTSTSDEPPQVVRESIDAAHQVIEVALTRDVRVKQLRLRKSPGSQRWLLCRQR